LVYDITRPATFTSATSWLSDLRAHADPNIAIGTHPFGGGWLKGVVLVGNKADLSQDRKVTTEEARQWARENDVSVCVESSAKSGDGVEDAFQRVAEEVFRKIRDGVFDLTDKVPPRFLGRVLMISLLGLKSINPRTRH
jgi:Ras-related protein Rab-2A